MKLSIIIPVFNVAPFLDDCINSFLNQNLQLGTDYEIICVNDGSTDNSLEILRQYSSKLTILNQKNQGVSIARNNGFEEAKGDYVWFIDSDDYVMNNILKQIIHIIEKNNLCCLKIERSIVRENSHPKNENYPYFETQESKLSKTQTTAFNLIVKRKYLLNNNIKFNINMKYGEDTLWVFWVLFFKPYIKYIEHPIYFYRIRKGSSMRTKTNEATIAHLESIELMLNEYKLALESYQAKLSKKEIMNLKYYINYLKQVILFDLLKLSKKLKDEKLSRLEISGDYPYPISWRHIPLSGGYKYFLIFLFSLFFPIKCYYNFVWNVFHKINSR